MNFRTPLSWAAAAAALVCCGCGKTPDAYAPPVQRPSFENARPYGITRIIDMSESEKPYFVRDISTGAQDWRWTLKRPTVRLMVRSSDYLHYVIDFAIAGATFKQTGPVTLSFYVNDRLLDRVRYTAPGVQHFDKLIPDGWVQPGVETTLAAEIDKLWVSPSDERRLGFILTDIGIEQEPERTSK